MTKTFLLFLMLLPLLSTGQASVEKSIFIIQTGVLGVWANNESRLTNSLALRTEFGLDAGIYGGSLYENAGFLLAPVLTLEPRWYYNIVKRSGKSKNIAGNSANFVTLKTSYHPDWFVISGSENINVVSQLSFIPTWGVRRTVGKHFNYEAGFGAGYRRIFANSDFTGDKNEGEVNLHLRIGYQF